VNQPSNRPSVDDLGQLFDGAADPYARWTPPYSPGIFPYLRGELDLSPVLRIADLGCGSAPRRWRACRPRPPTACGR
jgi:hypothetical protein